MSVASMLREARSHLGLGEPNHIQRWYARRNGSAYSYNFPWCAAFITYIAYQSGNYDAVRPRGDRAYTVYGARDAEQVGRYYTGTAANIRRHMKPGAVYWCDWDGSNSIPRVDHVGVCERNLGDGRIVGIEGNTSDRCARRVRGPSVIAGFWNPDYSGTSGGGSSSDDRLLRRGDRGPAVEQWQNKLRQWNPNALPKFGADGDFGAETETWTKRFQRAAGITVDGEVGPQTRQAMTRALKGEPEEDDVAAEDVWTHEWPYHGGDPIQASTYLSRAYVHALQAHQLLKGIAEKVGAPVQVDVDEAALAKEILAALPADLAQRIAREALDEAAARLAG